MVTQTPDKPVLFTRGLKQLKLRLFAFVVIGLVATPSFLYLKTSLKSQPVSAATGINEQISFQGKLVNTNGTNVTDGNYSIVFSIYTVSSGGTAVWTETQNPVAVSNGIFQVELGSVTTLPGSVDFNTDNIYLGIKVGADAEMTPRIRFGAVPQAFNADRLDGLDSSGFIQNTTSQQASSNFNISGAGVIGTTLTTPVLQSAATTNLTIQTTTSGNILLNSAGTIELQDNTNVTGDLDVSGGLTVATSNSFTVTSAGSLTSSLGNSGTWGVTSSLTGGARSSDVVTISQANDASNDSSQSLLEVNNQDTGSTVATLNVVTAANNVLAVGVGVNTGAASIGFNVTGTTTGVGLSVNTITTGSGVSGGGAITSGQLLLMNLASNTVLTSGAAVRVSGAQSGALPAYTGAFLDVQPGRTITGATTIDDTGNFLNLNRSVTNNGSGTVTVSGDLASLASNCGGSGTCTDTANILQLQQSYASASGAVLNIQNSGTGADIAFNTTPTLTIGDTGTLTITDGTNTLLSLTDNASTSGLTVNGATSVANTNVNLFNTSITATGGLITSAFKAQAVMDFTSAASQSIFSVNGNLVYSVTNSSNYTGNGIGVYGNIDWRGSGNSSGSRLDGVRGSVISYAGGGTIDNAAALSGGFTFNGGAVNTAQGLLFNDPGGSSAITTLYGIRIGSLTRGTTNYAILTEGTTQSSFGGNVGIGDTTPDAKLEVLSTTEQLRLTYTDGTVDSRFTVDSSGNLTVDNTGTKTVIADDLQITGNDLLDSGATTRLTLGATNAFTGIVTGSSTATFSGASVTVGAAALQGNFIINDGDGETVTITIDDVAANSTVKIPDTVSASDTFCLLTLANCGSGTTTLQSAYGNDVDGSDAIIALTTADDSIIIRNPAASGTDSAFLLELENLKTGSTVANFKNGWITASGSYDATAGNLTNYGMYIDNTSTRSAGANNVTNVALYLNASGGQNNASLIVNAGNVGIGDASPTALFTVGSGDRFTIDNDGTTVISQAAVSTGAIALDIDAGNHTNVTATRPTLRVQQSTLTITGAIGTQGFSTFNQSTITAGSALTVTDAATIHVEGAPIRSGSAAITETHGILISGGSSVGTATRSYGLSVNAPTGATDNYAAKFIGGNVGIGDASPLGLLTVGTSDAFQVSSAGAISTSATGTALTLSGAATTAINISNTGVTTDINLQNSETIHNNTDGDITFTRSDANSDTISIRPATGAASIAGILTSSDLTVSAKTWTLPNASGTIAVSASGNIALSALGDISFTGTLGATNGGTGQNTYAVGDLLYASSTTALSRLAAVATGSCLISQGVSTAPAWGSCGASNTLQGVYNNDVDGSDAIIALTTADDSIIIRNPAASGSDSTYPLTIDQLNTGAFGGLFINSLGTGAALRVDDSSGDTSPFIIDQNGNVGIGNDTTPASLLTVGTSDAFTVSSTGAVFSASTIRGGGSSGDAFLIGNDSLLRDIDVAHTAGLYSQTDATVGALRFGSSANVFISSVANASSYFNNGGNLGVGDATPDAKLDVESTSTANSGSSNYGIYNNLTVSPSSAPAATTYFYGIQNNITTNSANANSNTVLIGMESNAFNTGTTSIAALHGVTATAQKTGTGAVATAYGLYTHISNANATGAITTAYGLFIADSTETGAITNDYGIYQVDTGADNFFGGTLTLNAGGLTNSLVVDAESGTIVRLSINSGASRTLHLVNPNSGVFNLDVEGFLTGDGNCSSPSIATNCIEVGTGLAGFDLSVNDDIYASDDIEAGGSTRYSDATAVGATGLCRSNAGAPFFIGHCSSLQKYKDNTTDLSIGLSTLRQLRPVEFDWNIDTQRHDLGFIAEEVAAVNPLLAEYDSNGQLTSVKYNLLTSLITKSVQQLDVQVQGQQASLNVATQVNASQNSNLLNLNNKVNNLETKVSILQNQMTNGTFGTLNVSGNVTVHSLSVLTDATVEGTLTANTLVVTEKIIVEGHIYSHGEAPEIEAQPNLGVLSASVALDGTDTAGTLTMVAGDTPATGVLAKITFNKEYEKAPRIVLSAINEDGLSLPVYARKVADGFEIVTTGTPVAGKTYQFDYVIIGSDVATQ